MGSAVCSVICGLLLSDTFSPRGSAQGHRFSIGVCRLSVELDAWYTAEKSSGRSPNELDQLAAVMFGKPAVH
eukprot:4612917-Pyramimonas_sp.AAC.1